MGPTRGLSLADSLVTLALIGIAVAFAIPSTARWMGSARCAAGAREMATKFSAMRWKSVSTHRTHGMYFVADSMGWKWFLVRDENGNGMRTAEVLSGVDSTLSGPHRLEHRIEGVRPGFPPNRSFPLIPPASGAIGALGDPVKFGASNLISFSPMGSSSSGTLYLTDGRRELYGVRLYGPSARVRVWRFNWENGRWMQ